MSENCLRTFIYVTLRNDNQIWNQTLKDVMIPLHPFPEGFITKPTRVWPAIKLTSEGIYAHADLQITGISTQGYEGATAYLTKLIRAANNQIRYQKHDVAGLVGMQTVVLIKLVLNAKFISSKTVKRLTSGTHALKRGLLAMSVLTVC